MSTSALAFSLLPSDIAQFSPRLGSLSLRRRDSSTSSVIEIKTPNFTTSTSRGVIPHLSRDHVRSIKSIRWTGVPFESFLDRVPPVPVLQTGSAPLHTFLGYDRGQHILAMSVRDPFDGRDMPANGKDHISALCIRGVRKVTPSSWKSYFYSCKPDVVVALSDVPYTQAPQSQKRLQKSIERSTVWLTHLLSKSDAPAAASSPEAPSGRPNVLVNLVGGTDERARAAFSENLVEILQGKEQEQISPLRTLDEGVTGYQFELLPLRATLRAEYGQVSQEQDSTSEAGQLSALMRASLHSLPSNKLRITYGSQTPHEILRFIRDVGVDLFDIDWAQRAASIGVTLDFRFPVPKTSVQYSVCVQPKTRGVGKADIGHNLFNFDYAHDHSRLASTFLDGEAFLATQNQNSDKLPCCHCGACTPQPFASTLLHDQVTEVREHPTSPIPPYTRSYVHHLLHTHEMSSHTLLVMHNIAVMDAFFSGIREVLQKSHSEPDLFATEVDRFLSTYAEPETLFAEAEKDWAKVESERGKGRLAREKQNQGGGEVEEG
ncbi:tRNA-guanine(15) transglycosylase-like protein [Cristinia sonorae]|uniref:tRNA-guanine(15) transglycosylase-like protein n=1 Tax=Cristinia sonorae TaxID=1940300 RepID=A0A8K0UD20_9AGAR|nr:tRNA-guanine(15) transglycosylase-like protein [Cristinia sonorae]